MPRFGSGKDVPSPSSMVAVLPKADIDCYRYEVRFASNRGFPSHRAMAPTPWSARYQSLICTGVGVFFFDATGAGANSDSAWFEATAAGARSACRGRGNGGG